MQTALHDLPWRTYFPAVRHVPLAYADPAQHLSTSAPQRERQVRIQHDLDDLSADHPIRPTRQALPPLYRIQQQWPPYNAGMFRAKTPASYIAGTGIIPHTACHAGCCNPILTNNTACNAILSAVCWASALPNDVRGTQFL